MVGARNRTAARGLLEPPLLLLLLVLLLLLLLVLLLVLLLLLLVLVLLGLLAKARNDERGHRQRSRGLWAGK